MSSSHRRYAAYQPGRAVRWLLLGLFLLAFVWPLTNLFWSLGDVNVLRILKSRSVLKALTNSLWVSSCATVIAVTLGGLLAWGIVRTRMAGKRFFEAIFVIPMLIPSLSHGMGLILLFGANGIVTKTLDWDGSIYGFWGIVIGSVLYALPVAFLMIADLLKYESRAHYEAADVLGIPRSSQFIHLTLPYLAKPMIGVIFAIFTLVVTDYGVPLMIGGKFTTLPVLMYQETIGLLNFGKGAVIGSLLLVPAVLAFVLELGTRQSRAEGQTVRIGDRAHSQWFEGLMTALCSAVSLFILMPILAFVFLSVVSKYPIDLSVSLAHIGHALNLNAMTYLGYSLWISFLVAVVGVICATAAAYFSSRTSSKLGRLVHFIALVTLTVPGMVLGLSYVLAFNSTFIYGTLAILVLVNIMHFFATPYLMMCNSFGKLNEHLEAVGDTLGISRWRLFIDVLLPQTRATQVEMFVYFFVNSMVTISAVSFLATVANKPLSLMINQFEAQMMIECSAFVSVLILVVNLLVKWGAQYFKAKKGAF